MITFLVLTRSGVPAIEAPVSVPDSACIAEGAALIQQLRVVQRTSVFDRRAIAARELVDRVEVSSGVLHEHTSVSTASARVPLLVGQQKELELIRMASLVEAIVLCVVVLSLILPQGKGALPLHLLFQALSTASIVMSLVAEAFVIALSQGVVVAAVGDASVEGLAAWPRFAQNAASVGVLLGMLSVYCVNRSRSFAWRKACSLIAPLASAAKYTALAYALLSRADGVEAVAIAMRVAAGFAKSSSVLLSAVARESSAAGNGRFAVDCFAVVGGVVLGPAVAAAWISAPHALSDTHDRPGLAPAISGMCFLSLANTLLAFLASISAPAKGEEENEWPASESCRRPGFSLLMMCACMVVETSSSLICEIRVS